MSAIHGQLFGIGGGPGPRGLLPVAAVEALSRAAVIYLPRARSAELSIARQCLEGLDVPASRLREIEFTMDPDRTVLREHYATLAREIAVERGAGRGGAGRARGGPGAGAAGGDAGAARRERLP